MKRKPYQVVRHIIIERTMAGLHFDITADNSNLTQKIQETERRIKYMSNAVEQEGGSIETLFSRMTRAAAAFGAGFTAKELIQNIIQVRGEFQQLEVAFTTMLGSQEKASALMSQLTETAAKTPFDLQGVANGARQLLAYGTSAEDVNETLIRLGNIAAGLSIPLNDLVYLYGTTMTQGRLYTEDLNQFTGRGIPMIKELAKEFGVAESEIKAMVEAGKIGFPEVQKVINNLTNEGGMFFNLMQEQSKTITGQISNIGDSFSMMLNEIGQANEGIINDALGGVSYLIENYESIGKTLLEIVGTYGVYKASLITITALQKAYSAVLTQSALNQKLAAASGVALSNAQALAATRTKLLQMAQAALNKTMLANPYVAAAAAVAALGLGLYKLATYQTAAQKAQEKLNKVIKETESASFGEERNLSRLRGELSGLKEGTEEYNAVKEKIIEGYSKYYDGLEEEINQVGLTEQAYKNLTEAIRKSFAQRQYRQFMSEQDTELNNLMSKNLGKIQDKLIEHFGDTVGSTYYAKIRDALLQGSLDAEYIMNKRINIKGLDDETVKALDEVSGYGEDFIYNQKIERWIAQIVEAYKTTDELSRKFKARFGIEDAAKPLEETTDEPFSAEGKSISQLEEEIKKAKSRLEELKKSLADGSGTQEAVKQQEAYIKSLQDTVLEREKDLKVISQVEAQISKLKKEQKETVYGSKEYNSLQSRIDALDARLPQTKSERKQEDTQAKKQKDAQQKLQNELLQLILENQKQETDLMQEGAKKKLKLIDDDYNARKLEISKKEQELARLNKNAGVTDVNANGLTTEQQTRIDEANRLNEKSRKKSIDEARKEEEQAMNAYLREYGTYQEKRLAITSDYAEKIAQAGGEGTWQGKLLAKERDNLLADLDAEALQTTSAISDLFGDMTDKTLKELERINREGSAALEFLKGGQWDEEKGIRFGIDKEQFDTLSQSPEKLKAISDALNDNREAAEALRPAYEMVADGLRDLFNAGSDSKKVNEALADIQAGLEKTTQAASFLSDTFSTLGDAFGSNALSGIAEGINAAADSLNSALSGMQSGAQIGSMFGGAGGVVGSVAGGVVGLFSGIAGAIAKIHDKKNEKRIQRLQDQVDTLTDSYDQLGRAVEDAYSKDASALIEDQNKLLEQQKVLIQQQIREEEDKKKTDNDRIKQWQQQIEDINRTLEENKEKAVDAIFGEDVQSAIENFVDAYAEAWDSGEDRATAAKDTVKQMMKQMVTESIKAAIQSSGAMEEIREKLRQFYAAPAGSRTTSTPWPRSFRKSLTGSSAGRTAFSKKKRAASSNRPPKATASRPRRTVWT